MPPTPPPPPRGVRGNSKQLPPPTHFIKLIYTPVMVTVGLLSAVDAVTITTSDPGFILSLTWEPPFTLDIDGVDPDITYCVDVINSTSSVTLHSECGITETEFSYPLPQDAVCHSYVLTITPVNVVGRGVSSSLTYIGTEAGMRAICKHSN